MRESLGQLIQRRLEDLKMSRSKLAREIKKSRAYVGDLANDTANTKSGKYRPSPETVADLARTLEVPRETILASIEYLPQTNGNADLANVGINLFNGDWNELTPEEQQEILEVTRMLIQTKTRRKKR